MPGPTTPSEPTTTEPTPDSIPTEPESAESSEHAKAQPAKPDTAKAEPTAPARTSRREAGRADRGSDRGVDLGAWREWLLVVGGIVLALLLWWPLSWQGLVPFLQVPTGTQLGAAALGGLTGAAVVAALVTAPWPRFVLAVGLPVLALSLTGLGALPPLGLALVVVAVLLGLALGAGAAASPVRFAVTTALVLGLCPAPHLMWGPLLALALALPFVRATASRVAPTVLGVVAVLLAFAVGVALRTGVVAGFAGTPRRSGLALVTDGLRASGTPIRAQGVDAARRALELGTTWYVVAAVLAVVVVLARGAAAARRRTASA